MKILILRAFAPEKAIIVQKWRGHPILSQTCVMICVVIVISVRELGMGIQFKSWVTSVVELLTIGMKWVLLTVFVILLGLTILIAVKILITHLNDF